MACCILQYDDAANYVLLSKCAIAVLFLVLLLRLLLLLLEPSTVSVSSFLLWRIIPSTPHARLAASFSMPPLVLLLVGWPYPALLLCPMHWYSLFTSLLLLALSDQSVDHFLHFTPSKSSRNACPSTCCSMKRNYDNDSGGYDSFAKRSRHAHAQTRVIQFALLPFFLSQWRFLNWRPRYVPISFSCRHQVR